MNFLPETQSVAIYAPRSSFEKLSEYARYRRGWAYGEGIPFDPETIRTAEALLATANSNGFWITDVFPGLEGEIRVALYVGQEYWEFTALRSGHIDYVHEREDRILADRPSLTRENAINEIAEAGRNQWNAFVSFPLNISTLTAGGSRIWHSSRQAMMGQSQSSMQIAPDQRQGLSAITFDVSMAS